MSSRSVIIITQTWFEENSAGIGGAMYSQDNSDITIFNTTFVQNHAIANCCNDTFLVVVFCLQTVGVYSVKVSDSNFKQNVAVSHGGVFLFDKILTT